MSPPQAPPLRLLPPGVYALAAVPGMAAEDAARLGRLGCHTTADLRDGDLAALARASGIGQGHLQHWRDAAGLMALDGVGPAFAAALLEAGLASVRIVARLTPEDVERFLRRSLRRSHADGDGLQGREELPVKCKRLVEEARRAEARGP